MRPSKGLGPICGIKTLSDVNKKTCVRSREVESRCKVVEVYSVKKSYLNTQGISQTVLISFVTLLKIGVITSSYFPENSKIPYNGKNIKKNFLQLRCFNVLLHLKYKVLLCEPKIKFKKVAGGKALATDHLASRLFGKQSNLARDIHTFENFLSGISIPLNDSSRNFRNFRLNGSHFGNLTIFGSSRNFPYQNF